MKNLKFWSNLSYGIQNDVSKTFKNKSSPPSRKSSGQKDWDSVSLSKTEIIEHPLDLSCDSLLRSSNFFRLNRFNTNPSKCSHRKFRKNPENPPEIIIFKLTTLWENICNHLKYLFFFSDFQNFVDFCGPLPIVRGFYWRFM